MERFPLPKEYCLSFSGSDNFPDIDFLFVNYLARKSVNENGSKFEYHGPIVKYKGQDLRHGYGILIGHLHCNSLLIRHGLFNMGELVRGQNIKVMQDKSVVYNEGVFGQKG